MIAVFAYALAVLAGAQATTPANSVAPYAISGTVVYDRDGKSAAGVTLTIVLGPSLFMATSAEDGSFHFDGLKPGKYSLLAQKRGYPQQSLDEHRGFSTAVAVGPDLKSDAIVFRLHPDSSIAGQVTDEQGDPVQAAQLHLFHMPAGEVNAVMITDERGTYRFSHLQPGQYVIAVTATPWYADYSVPREGDASPLDMVYPLTFYGGASTPEAATRIPLGWGQSVTANVVLTAMRSLHLKVHMPPVTPEKPGALREVIADGPLDPGSVNLRRRVFGQEMGVGFTTMRDGVMEVSGLAPGHYQVNVRSQGRGDRPNVSRWEIDADGNADLDASQGGRHLATLSGTLQSDGDPVKEGTFVRLHLRESATWAIAPVQEGKFEFGEELMPGKYEVDFQGSDTLYLKSMEASGARASSSMVEIAADPVVLKLTAARGIGRVDGVALADGHPRGGALVVLVPEGREEMRYSRDQSDSDGTFTLANVVPGNYRVFATLDWEIDWKDEETLKRFLPGSARVKVEAGGNYKVEVKVQ